LGEGTFRKLSVGNVLPFVIPRQQHAAVLWRSSFISSSTAQKQEEDRQRHRGCVIHSMERDVLQEDSISSQYLSL